VKASLELNFLRTVTNHVWRDSEVLRRMGIVTAKFMQYSWILEVPLHDVVRVAVGRNAVQIEIGNFLPGEEFEISYR